VSDSRIVLKRRRGRFSSKIRDECSHYNSDRAN
jgi:hypothetical protein